MRDEKRDGVTEEHTFQPKRIARRSGVRTSLVVVKELEQPLSSVSSVPSARMKNILGEF